MKMYLEEIRSKIEERHSKDKKQLEVIFSDKPRLLVVAPAGYGKTRTMISKIAYMLATNQIPYPKRLLALTFSVNAAYKIKKEISQQLPEILEGVEYNIDKKLFVSNYHGFCRNILKKYGYLFHENLRQIDFLQAIDDSNIKKLQQTIKGLSFEDSKKLSDFNDAVKEVDKEYAQKNLLDYNQIIIKELIPKGFISFNAILTLIINLFQDYPEIIRFYQNYIPAILVDEYQDTNILSSYLLKLLITDKTKLVLFGDFLQRIYGFIGAMPNLLDFSEREFNMKRIELSTNYRFKDNAQMLLLDNNIRKIAINPRSPSIEQDAEITFFYLNDQDKEANKIIEIVRGILNKYPDSKIAILVKQRGKNIERIISKVRDENIKFFYGLFTDDDPNYVNFHKKCIINFTKLIKQDNRISRVKLKLLEKQIREEYENDDSILIQSLINLLSVFLKSIFTKFAFLTNEEKMQLIKETFEYNALRQHLEFIENNILISTVHGAKGLEWDYVILPDMEAFSFPNWHGLCKLCQFKEDCYINWNSDYANDENFKRKFFEELSVFYVGVTRARKHIFFTASKYQINYEGDPVERNISCFLKLPGIKLNNGVTK